MVIFSEAMAFRQVCTSCSGFFPGLFSPPASSTADSMPRNDPSLLGVVGAEERGASGLEEGGGVEVEGNIWCPPMGTNGRSERVECWE